MDALNKNWLGESPEFYNLKTGSVDRNINNVIDFANLEISSEGLHNYLKFGYSVFGRTPIERVHFLRQNESIVYGGSGRLAISVSADPCIDEIERSTSEKNAWEVFSASVAAIGDRFDGPVCIPVSGGYDSRLIANFFPQKKNIRAFTYGISRLQHESFESVNAKAVCEKLGIDWKLIELGKFNKYIPEWIDLYGPSTHAHGMYHLEFYSEIRNRYGKMPVISGIVGDAWAGSLKTLAPKSPEDLVTLGYSHGLKADSSECLLPYRGDLIEQEFETYRGLLENERYRAIYLVRTKMVLLSYLLKVPTALDMPASSPFTEFDVAMSMLTIEPERWRDRIWQKDFVAKNGLDVERSNLSMSYRNDLDFYSLKTSPLVPLSTQVLSELFKTNYIEWINKHVKSINTQSLMVHWALGLPKIGTLLRRMGINDQALSAYSAYLVLKPIEDLLIRRDQARLESRA